MPLDLSALDKLRALSPEMEFSWRTRRAGTGWQAQCSAGFADYISPCWQASGATEQQALDLAVECAIGYWREYARIRADRRCRTQSPGSPALR